MANFYSRLSYSFGNEDWKTELDALKIKSNDRVVCITASGDRPLHLLLSDLKELVSVDANPFQNHLFELKKAAMLGLEHEDYLSFVGAKQHAVRMQLFHKISAYLPDESIRFWKKRKKMIERGVIYQGVTEKWCKRMGLILRTVRGDKIHRLFSFDDLEEQKAFVKKHWDSPLWISSINFALHPLLTRLFFKDPGLYENLGPSMHAATYVRERLNQCLEKSLAKTNAFVSLILKGKVAEEAFPPCLTEDGTAMIKKRLGKVTVETKNIISFLESSPQNSFDAFSISDVASYLNVEGFERLLAAMIKCARPGARFCMRQFLSSHRIPNQYASYFNRDYALEEKLENEDRTFVYRFMTGTINNTKRDK